MLATRESNHQGRRSSPSDQTRAFSTILREEFGVPFRLHDATSGELMDGLDLAGADGPPLDDPRGACELAREGKARVLPATDGRFEVLIPFAEADRPPLV